MLVLTRKVGEKILVPRCQLSVTVLEITPSRVRLGISAPVGVAVYREEVEKQAAKQVVLPGGATLISARILIADPDRFLLASYSRCLCERGAIVSTATSGTECAERLRSAVPDILVLEPALLWGGGDGVLALIEENPTLRPAVVIILSQPRNRSPLYRLSWFKVDDYQTKPLSADDLAARICTLLSSASERAVLPR